MTDLYKFKIQATILFDSVEVELDVEAKYENSAIELASLEIDSMNPDPGPYDVEYHSIEKGERLDQEEENEPANHSQERCDETVDMFN